MWLSTSNMSTEYRMPMVINQSGYVSTFSAKLHGDEIHAKTSLPYVSLLDHCRELNFRLDMHTPLAWNDMSVWSMDVQVDEPVIHFIKAQVPFFLDLLAGFSSPPREDAHLDFTPITYNFNVMLKESYLLHVVNRFNVVYETKESDAQVGTAWCRLRCVDHG